MKNFLLALCLLFAFTSISYAQKPEKSKSENNQHEYYCCPHHKNIHGKQGDKCSECGMNLVKMGNRPMYYCKSCHTTSDMSGKCAKCGTEMMKINGDENHHSQKMYTCNMCGTSSDKPGKCSKCGMKMTKMKQKKERHEKRNMKEKEENEDKNEKEND